MKVRKSIIQPITLVFGTLFLCIIGLTVFNVYQNMTMMHDRVNIERINGISNVIANTFRHETETMSHGVSLIREVIKKQYTSNSTPKDIQTILDNQTYLVKELELIVVYDTDLNIIYKHDDYSIIPTVTPNLIFDHTANVKYFVNYINNNVYVFGQIRIQLNGNGYYVVIAFISDLVSIALDQNADTHFRLKSNNGVTIVQDAKFDQFKPQSMEYYTHVEKEITVFNYPFILEMFSHQSIFQVLGYGNLWFTFGMIVIIISVYIFIAYYIFSYVMVPLRDMRTDLYNEIKNVSTDELIADPNYDLQEENEISALINYFQFFIDSIKTLINKVNTQRNKLNMVINSIHVGIVEIDAETFLIKDINKCALEILGIDRKDCIGQPCYYQLCDHLKCEGGNVDKCAAKQITDTDYSFECFIANKRTHEETPVLKSLVNLPLGDGNSILVTFINIADLKSKEEELRRAVGRADRATMGKTILLGNVSHDIGNILTSLKGNAEILKRQELTDDQHKIVDVIIDSSVSIANAVELMRERTLLETGQSKLNLQPVNLTEILLRLYRSQLVKCSDKNIEFLYDGIVNKGITPKDLYVNIDSAKLQAVLNNIFDNAVKFTTIGHVRCTVQILTDLETTVNMKFRIADTGIGISKDSVESIFNIYEQANESIQSEYGGTGIGLSICQHYVKMMGGTISVESIVGEGSIFSFDLQFEKCLNIETEESESEQYDKNTDQLKIIVAEDSNAIQMVIDDKLKQLNCDTTIVSNGRDAVNLINNSYYDLLFLDIRMPIMSGMDAIQMIRDEKFQLPVIALTANSSETDIQLYLEAGFDDCVPKPVSDDNLNRILMKYKNRQLINLDYVNSNYKTADFYLQILESAKNEFKMNLEMLTLFEQDTNFTNLKHYIKTAHSIKSIASQVGMESVRHIAHILEMKFVGGINFQDVSDVKELISLLKIQFQKSLEYYDQQNQT